MFTQQRQQFSQMDDPSVTFPTGTEFFRDFAPGTYTFTVEPYGLPTPQAVTLQLAAGKQGSVSTCARWRIPVVVGYAAARFSLVRGMKRDAVPGMSIHGRQASV